MGRGKTITVYGRGVVIGVLALLLLGAWAGAEESAVPSGAFVRVAIKSPQDREWRVHVIVHTPGAKSKDVVVGKTISADGKDAGFIPARSATPWVDLSDTVLPQGASVRFIFETRPSLEKAGVEASIDVATSADEKAILRTVTDHDPGDVISIRIPPDLGKSKDIILSIREDTSRRLNELKAMHLPDGPLPKKIWCMTGFRSNGQFYTDPAIAEMDFDIVKLLGMNGWWEQNGGQPGALRKMAADHGLDRSTVYWRNVESLPRDNDMAGATRLQWDKLDEFFDQSYRDGIANTRKQHPAGMPEVLADLMDEPAGQHLGGPEYQQQFREYARGQGLTPSFFGKEKWEEITPIDLEWGKYFSERSKLDLKDRTVRHLLYWSTRFWNYSTARLYAMATRKVEEYAPGTLTRINCGPPWWYDYGTLPRGIDIFEFGRLRSVSMGFNEDWVGKGNRRVPLEINTLLMDWSRAAARPNTPLLGSYITRDADRASVKLRTVACLAREAKIFDFYYYGLAYTFFDHWSDNASMVQGVGELTRDIGLCDDVLWDGHAPKAQVALLYSHSWPLWKQDDTEQCEQMMTYLALLHAGIAVDIVSDAEISDGRFAARRYKCLYVVNESIPTKAAESIDQWVRDGGKLWAAGWAGMKNEYDSPSNTWNELFHVKSRTWNAVGDLKRQGEVIRADDWQRPIFGREVACELIDGTGVKVPQGAGESPKAYRYSRGAGEIEVVPWTAGKAYMDGATENAGKLAHATIFPDDARRTIFSEFAAHAGVIAPATTSVNAVLAWPLWAQHQGVILLANYTGEAVEKVHVKVETPWPITRARALHGGVLEIARPDPGHIEFTVPMNDVTDMIQVE